jgi:hypothetical protein
LKLSEIDDELFGLLRAEFQLDILELEGRGNATWYDYYALGMSLYEQGDQLWQVFGVKKVWLNSGQDVHLDMASYAFNAAIDILRATPGPNPLENEARIDMLTCMKIVAEVMLMRAYNEATELHPLVQTVVGNDESAGIVGRCMQRLQESPVRQRQFAATVNALGFRLVGGKTFGLPQAHDAGKAASLLKNALELFEAESSDSLDKEYVYRGLLFDAALDAFTRGDRVVGRAYARKARRSAARYGYTSHAYRAWLVGLFGRFGNRLWCGVTLLNPPS